MIACIAKNDRGRGVFRELASIDPRYKDLGYIPPDRNALLSGFLKSATTSLAQMKRDARMSPDFLTSVTRECTSALSKLTEHVDALVYWGATNMPLDPKVHKFPYFVVSDGPFDPNDPTYPIEWRPQRWAKQYFDIQRDVFTGALHTFTLSEWARRKIIEVHKVAPEKVSKIGWGPLGAFGPPLTLPPSGKKVFVSVGSDWRRKGMDVVAEAGALLAARRSDVETIIAGVPGDLVLSPKKGVSLLPLNVPPAVVHSLMRQATALIITARFDASPHVIYEALQYGTPVIGSNSCGIPEAIDPPHGGVVIENLDARCLADAMETLLERDEETSRADAYATYVKSGGWKQCAVRIHEQVSKSLGM